MRRPSDGSPPGTGKYEGRGRGVLWNTIAKAIFRNAHDDAQPSIRPPQFNPKVCPT
jgi:hypothetical protein